MLPRKACERYDILRNKWEILAGEVPQHVIRADAQTLKQRFIFTFTNWKIMKLDTFKLKKGWETVNLTMFDE